MALTRTSPLLAVSGREPDRFEACSARRACPRSRGRSSSSRTTSRWRWSRSCWHSCCSRTGAWPARRATSSRRAAVSRARWRIVPGLRAAPGHLRPTPRSATSDHREGVDLVDPPCSSRSSSRRRRTAAVPRAAWVVQWLILVVLLCGSRLAYRFAKGAARRARAGAVRPPRPRDVPVPLAPVRWPPFTSARSAPRPGPTCGSSASSRTPAPRAGALCTTSRSSAAHRTWIGSSPSSRSRAFTPGADRLHPHRRASPPEVRAFAERCPPPRPGAAFPARPPGGAPGRERVP